MRVPKVGEKWGRHDGKTNNVTIKAVTPDLLKDPNKTRVQYRYDDGYTSSRLLPDFHAKFLAPAESVAAEALPAVVATSPQVPQVVKKPDVPVQDVTKILTIARAEHIKAYYGYDSIKDNPLKPREGNWDDPEYRARYTGLKK